MSAKRIYTFSFENVTVAEVRDLFYIKAGASNGVILHSVEVSAGGVTASAEIRLRIKRLPATVTVGSGGNSVTASKASSNNGTAAASTCRTVDTTQATTSGTSVTLWNGQWNVLVPFENTRPEETRFDCAPSEAIVFDTVAAPASTVLSGTITFEEVP